MAWAPNYADAADDFGSYVDIDDLEDAAEAELAVAAASRGIDAHCHRQFGKVDEPEERFYPAAYRCGWVIDIDDLMTTDGLVVTVDGTVVTNYVLKPRNSPQKDRPWTRLHFTDESEAVPSAVGEEVSAVAPWGWSAIPPTVKNATLLQTARFFKRRQAPFGVAGSAEFGSELRLLSKIDPDVAVMLRPYRRIGPIG